ncbi:hypothetical protein BGZ65_003332 [Modicella reniformis]|uniref:Alcohol dehydrogenase-like C-terminal domain-containing protein n=1 Tax=Modicella reniformis TaxID=1440133 RepID=A0A9P6J0A9_9FUNG|nr:hypothetical protein BGZ65_003332 [Modicella reniformis]
MDDLFPGVFFVSPTNLYRVQYTVKYEKYFILFLFLLDKKKKAFLDIVLSSDRKSEVESSLGWRTDRPDIIVVADHGEVIEVAWFNQVTDVIKNGWDLYRLVRLGRSNLALGSDLVPLIQVVGNQGTYLRIKQKEGVMVMEKVGTFTVPTLLSHMTSFSFEIPDDIDTKHGTMVLLAIPEVPVQLNAGTLMYNQISLAGSLIGGRRSFQEMLQFAADKGVRPWIEKMPMSDPNVAFKRLMEGHPRYRVVMETEAANRL